LQLLHRSHSVGVAAQELTLQALPCRSESAGRDAWCRRCHARATLLQALLCRSHYCRLLCKSNHFKAGAAACAAIEEPLAVQELMLTVLLLRSLCCMCCCTGATAACAEPTLHVLLDRSQCCRPCCVGAIAAGPDVQEPLLQALLYKSHNAAGVPVSVLLLQ
jgi:hypothetical protein